MGGDLAALVRRQFERWNAEGSDWAFEGMAEDVVVHAPEGWPEGPKTVGIEAWRAQATRLRDTWDDARAEVDEVRQVGRDRVYARFRYVTSGEHGIGFDTPMAGAYFFEGGLIREIHFQWDPEEALRIAESGPPAGD